MMGGWVPDYSKEESVVETNRYSITVHPPSETRKPIGFAPWPEEDEITDTAGFIEHIVKHHAKPKKRRKKGKR